MTMDVLVQLILTAGIIPALLVYLVFTDRVERKAEREKSQEREVKLMEHISKSDATLNQFAESLRQIGDTMNSMDKSMGYLQRDVEELKCAK